MICSGEDTVLVVNDGQHLFAGRIQITQSLFLHNIPCFRSHVRQQIRQELFYLTQFLIRYRSTSVTFHTATTVAALQIATELLFQDIQTH